MNFLSLNCLILNIKLKIKIGPSLSVVRLVNTCLVFLAAVLKLRLLFFTYLPLLSLFTYSLCDCRFTMCALYGVASCITCATGCLNTN
jgi:hypothetical protein